MNIVICDDNKAFGNELAQYIKKQIISFGFDEQHNIKYMQSSKTLISYLENNDIDILFLDIRMPEVDGFDIAKYICDNELQIYIIFISSFDNNVFYSFHYHPFRYIRKERYKDEVIEALKSAYSELFTKYNSIVVTKYNDIWPIRISNIVYAEKEKRTNYMSIHTKNDVYRFRGTLTEFASKIDGCRFIKASPNAFINSDCIISITDNVINLRGGLKYTALSAKYLKDVKEKLFEYMRNR